MTLPRRAALAATLAGTALVASSCRSSSPGEPLRPPRGIVLVTIDTLRADRLPAYGYARGTTPRWDGLARRGIVFDAAWAQVPLTLPSHSTILTGLLPPEHGVRSNIGYSLASEIATLPELLAARDWATGGFVSAYVLRAATGVGAGFATYDDAIARDDEATLGALQRPGRETVARALAWLDAVGDRRFFLFVHLFEPHTPYEPPEPFRSGHRDPYDGEIAAADAALGELLDGLVARGKFDDTLLLVTSDHGEGLGDHGEREHGVLLYREALHVPMVVRLPGDARGGTRSSAPVGLVDVAPTLLGAAGIALPEGLAGRSLLSPELGSPARRIYGETLYPRLHLGWSELRSLADDRFQYIEGPDPELYDWIADPAERTNLFGRERRTAADRRSELGTIDLALAAPAPADPEERARLAALGYLGGSATPTAGDLPDPKRHLAALEKVQETFRLASAGELEAAAGLCREILAELPGMVDVRNQLAGVLRRLGRPEEALAEYEEVLRRSPALLDAVALEVAKVELDLGHLDRAELHARQAAKLFPAEAATIEAGAALARGDAARAREIAGRAVAGSAAPYPPALLALAEAELALGHSDAALAAADRIEALVAAGASSPLATVEALRGDALARLGRAAEAEAAFRGEIARFPRTAEAYVRLAILYASLRRFDEIEPLFDSMVTVLPNRQAHELAARTLDELGNREAAAAFRRRAARLPAPPLTQPTRR